MPQKNNSVLYTGVDRGYDENGNYYSYRTVLPLDEEFDSSEIQGETIHAVQLTTLLATADMALQSESLALSKLSREAILVGIYFAFNHSENIVTNTLASSTYGICKFLKLSNPQAVSASLVVRSAADYLQAENPNLVVRGTKTLTAVAANICCEALTTLGKFAYNAFADSRSQTEENRRLFDIRIS